VGTAPSQGEPESLYSGYGLRESIIRLSFYRTTKSPRGKRLNKMASIFQLVSQILVLSGNVLLNNNQAQNGKELARTLGAHENQ
jgi:hypothetical protein